MDPKMTAKLQALKKMQEEDPEANPLANEKPVRTPPVILYPENGLPGSKSSITGEVDLGAAPESDEIPSEVRNSAHGEGSILDLVKQLGGSAVDAITEIPENLVNAKRLMGGKVNEERLMGGKPKMSDAPATVVPDEEGLDLSKAKRPFNRRKCLRGKEE